MNRKILKYLSENCSTVPYKIDRLLVSAFVYQNKLNIKSNTLLKAHLIQENKNKENELLTDFLLLIDQEGIDLSIEFLIELFEFVISPADKIINGAVYTPLYIREYIISKTLIRRTDSLKICDPCCGCGGFLLSATKYIKSITQKSYEHIYKNIIHGLDVKDYSIQRTKILLSLFALCDGEDKDFSFNLFIGNALTHSFKEKLNGFDGFDVMVGNPPYVCSRNLDKKTVKLILNWPSCKSGHPDLYIPFFQIGLENLIENGVLGYITMNSFFKSLNGRALRTYFQEKKYKFKIFDFGFEQVFKSHNTYTCICIIQKTSADNIEYIKSSIDRLESLKTYDKIKYNDLDSTKGWNLQDNKIITKIETTGIPLGKLFRTSHGIATLRNDVYIFNPIKEDKTYYYLKSDKEYQIEKGICKNIINSNRLNKQFIISEKIIFPYNNDDIPYLFSEYFFKENYPQAYSYLNSKRDLLMKRDKGNGNYQEWFAFGRSQSLKKVKNKLLLPKMANRSPKCIINTDENVLYYNGQAIISHSIRMLDIIKKIIESKLFWYYIISTSKPYASGYYSLNGNYIKNFGLYEFSHDEEEYLINEPNKDRIDIFLEKKYNVSIRMNPNSSHHLSSLLSPVEKES